MRPKQPHEDSGTSDGLNPARLEKGWHLAAAGLDGDDWPFYIALGVPSRAALEADFPAARRWALEWTDWTETQGLRLHWQTRTVLGTKQQLR